MLVVRRRVARRRSQHDGGDAAESSVNLRGDIRNVAQEESSAAKPAEEAGFPLQHHTPACTAASVAAEATNTQPATMQELQELQAWLATCTEDMLRENRPLKRLKTAVAVCTLPSTAERRDGVQKLAGPQEWDVKQKERGVKRNAEQLHRALVEKVMTDGRFWQKKQRTILASGMLTIFTAHREQTAGQSHTAKPSEVCVDALAREALGNVTIDTQRRGNATCAGSCRGEA